MHRPLTLLLAVALLTGPAMHESRAQGLGSEETRITADSVSFERERDLYEAEGNVRVEQPGDRSLQADWMVVNTTTQIGVAVGNVVVSDGEDRLRADFAAVDLKTLQAITLGAALDVPEGLDVHAATLARTGERTYRVEQGTFTSCRCTLFGRRPWRIDVREADIELEGYAVARDVTFRVLDVPLVYTPWLILPVKSERQSGFLMPHMASTSRGGTEIELPFFWAARENANVLLRPTWITKRGFKLGAETEYLLGEAAEGSGGFAFLRSDDEVQDDPNLAFSENRWAYWLRHEQPLSGELRFGADVNQISDNYYVVDFEDLGDEARSARSLDSKLWTSFGRSSWYAGVEGVYLDDLQSPNDLDRDDHLLHKLPDVWLASLPRKAGPLPLHGGFDGRYTYFYQKEDTRLVRGNTATNGHFFDTGLDGTFDEDEPNAVGVFDGGNNSLDNFGVDLDGTEGDGLFQEGELLADFGNRWDVYPRLALPVSLGPIETLSEVGYRGTFYSPSNGSAETRSLWTARTEARMRFAKRFEIAGRSLRHLVEPRVAFGFISDQNQARNPLFIPEASVRQKRIIDRDLRVLLRNPSDRIAEERLIQASLSNRFYGAPGPDGQAARLLGALRLSGGYDLERSRGSNLYAIGSLHPADSLELSGTWGFDPKESHVDEVDIGLAWSSEPRFIDAPTSVSDRRHSLGVSYRYLRDIPRVFDTFARQDDVFAQSEPGFERINQLNVDLNLALLRQLDVFARGFGSFEESSTSAGQVGVAFVPRCACWEVVAAFEQRIRPDDHRFTIEFRLAGLGFEALVRRAGRLGARGTASGSVDGRGGLWDSPAP